NIEAVSADIRDILGRHKDELGDGIGEIDDTIASIHRASEKLETILDDVKEITGRKAEGTGTIGRLTQDEALIDEVQGIAEGLNDIVRVIGRLRTIAELRSEYNILAHTLQTSFSARLQARPQRCNPVLLVDGPRGDVRVSQTAGRPSPAIPGEPGEYPERRVPRTDRLRFTPPMGKPIGPATFRFGIMESK